MNAGPEISKALFPFFLFFFLFYTDPDPGYTVMPIYYPNATLPLLISLSPIIYYHEYLFGMKFIH